jgi:hypothetical protein
MDRRHFLATPLLVAPLGAAAQTVAPSSPRALMKVGTQHGDSDAILRVLAGFGVNHICSRLPPFDSTRSGRSSRSHASASTSNRSASRST